MKKNNTKADFIRFVGGAIVLLSIFFEGNIFGIVGLLLIASSIFFEED